MPVGRRTLAQSWLKSYNPYYPINISATFQNSSPLLSNFRLTLLNSAIVLDKCLAYSLVPLFTISLVFFFPFSFFILPFSILNLFFVWTSLSRTRLRMYTYKTLVLNNISNIYQKLSTTQGCKTWHQSSAHTPWINFNWLVAKKTTTTVRVTRQNWKGLRPAWTWDWLTGGSSAISSST